MKTVWVLEMLRTPDEMREAINDFEDMLHMETTEQIKVKLTETIHKLEMQMIEFPNGKFTGTIGRSIYKQFTKDAKDCIRRNKDRQFRVVKAEIEDDAQYWVNYKNSVENEGVLKFLYATL